MHSCKPPWRDAPSPRGGAFALRAAVRAHASPLGAMRLPPEGEHSPFGRPCVLMQAPLGAMRLPPEGEHSPFGRPCVLMQAPFGAMRLPPEGEHSPFGRPCVLIG